jgi:REP element-mobilizing transposase RayT
MGHTYTALHYHIIFATTDRVPSITPELQTRLYDYTGGIVRSENGSLMAIGGTPDHIHLLAAFHPATCVADMLRRIKANSSKWLHENLRQAQAFTWQSGYAVFTVSQSNLGDVEAYILNQQTHHANLSFEDEFLAFLQRHGIPYDERYVLG